MLALPMEQFVTNLVDWLPTYFQHIAEIIVYMIFLSILMLTPLFLWVGAAIATTKRQQRQVAPPTPRG
jgi:hypothetical protein